MPRSRRTSLAHVVALLGLVVVLGVPGWARAERSTTDVGGDGEASDAGRGPRTPRYPVSYLAGGSAYVDAGADDSLHVGDSLRVVRDGVTIALLRARFTSSHRAVCDTLWTRAPLAVGDDAVPSRKERPAVVTTDANAAKAPAVWPDSGAAVMATPQRPRGSRRPRGRIGVHWLSVETDGGGRFQQPALDLRFDGSNGAAGHLDVSLDLRARRTTRQFLDTDPQTDLQSRFYRAALTWRSIDANRRLTLGRQSSPTLASISLFDGALLELGDPTRTFGLFGGTQPDPSGYKLSSEIVESGAFVEWHQPPRSVRRWSIAAGGVSSQDRGQPNRDFMFAQGGWSSTRLNAWLAQEVDVNRGWKRDAGEPPLSPTNTFATARVNVREWLALTGGYDNRRNVRLYRDRLTPETEFDDAYRQGAWYGAQTTITRELQVSGELRLNTGAERATSWTASAELYRFAPLHATARARISNYSGGSVDSRLESASLGIDALPLSHFEASGGVRSTRNPQLLGEDREYWQTVDCDVAIGRRGYLNGGWERDYGGSAGDTRQLQLGVSWRF